VPGFARLCRQAGVAALLLAAAANGAWAQKMTPAPPEADPDAAQAPTLEAPPLPPPELRGTQTPDLNTLSNDTATSAGADDDNPVANPSPSYGLPPPVTSTSNFINYGRPKPKKSVLYQLPRIKRPGNPPLPRLTDYRTAAGLLRRGAVDLPVDLTDPGPTVAVIPTLPRPLRPKPDLTPFDPIGVDVGSLRLFPYIEAETGYDSNPNYLNTDIVPSAFVYAETGMKVQSLWSQNSLTADLRGGYYDYFSVPGANRPDAAGTITGRIDVTRQTQINLQTTFSLTSGQPGSPVLSVPTAVFTTNRPLYATVGQTLGITQQFNRLSVSLNSAFTRYAFGDATQSDGTELLLSMNDYNSYSIAGRVSYEVLPTLIPYLQVTGSRNQYDSSQDVYGFDRNSNGVIAEAGTTYQLTPLITGDVAVGYEQRFYADPRLPELGAPTIDASLIYSPTALTTVTLTAATDIEETTLQNASGVVAHTLSLKVTHDLLRNLRLTAIGTYQINNYVGQPDIEHYYSGEFDVDYHVTRSIVITGQYKYQNFTSTESFSNYTDNMFMAGLKFQL
jgi:hypothetical protein